MKSKKHKNNIFIRNASYSLTSNLFSFLVSAVVVLLVPKVMGVENYGFFQLYVFYTSYTGFLQLGWGDGMYLRYGGEYYEQLDKRKFSAQFWNTILYELIIIVLIAFSALSFVPDYNKQIVILCSGVYILIVWPRTILNYILQMTNRIKEYSFNVIIERAVYVLLAVGIVVLSADKYIYIILADFAGKTASLIMAIYNCKDIVMSRPESFSLALHETVEDIKVGIKLMLSSIASMLIIGIVRYSIENHWDIATFGKVSLSLSISNMLMVFVNAVALVMFPMLRRMDHERYASLYHTLRNALMILLIGMLVLYYPIKAGVSAWLPQYADSLKYMAMLFPICVFESKNSMLISTYMKTLRMEKKLLAANAATMILSGVLTWITVYRLNDLDLAILSIVVLIGIRCIISELMVARSLHISVLKDIWLETFGVVTFVVSSWLAGGIRGVCIYLLFYMAYLTVKRNDLKELITLLHK